MKSGPSGADDVFGINDTPEEVLGELSVEYWSYSGLGGNQKKTAVVLKPNTSTKLTSLSTPKN